MKTAGERLKAIRKHFKDTQGTLAKKIALTQENLSKYETGERPLSRGVAEKIQSAYPTVNLHWLLTGEGEMLLNVEKLVDGMVKSRFWVDALVEHYCSRVAQETGRSYLEVYEEIRSSAQQKHKDFLSMKTEVEEE
ncbi:MAG: helix-turn-helix transcriptional regulator [Saprospiraceae bacterium]|nr:helix-turn-helix transcriptional regulator [Saprospiraceae bacterium]